LNLGVSFAPLVPAYVVWAGFGAAVLMSLLLLITRSRGAVLRTVAMALMVLALANPSFTREDREPIPSVAAVIVDQSPSQDFGDRKKQTEAARAALVDRLKHIPGLEVRVADAAQADGENEGTKLFSALSSTLADVRAGRQLELDALSRSIHWMRESGPGRGPGVRPGVSGPPPMAGGE